MEVVLLYGTRSFLEAENSVGHIEYILFQNSSVTHGSRLMGQTIDQISQISTCQVSLHATEDIRISLGSSVEEEKKRGERRVKIDNFC
jgi:hypothetical protein